MEEKITDSDMEECKEREKGKGKQPRRVTELKMKMETKANPSEFDRINFVIDGC